jgi:hypothetical protein
MAPGARSFTRAVVEARLRSSDSASAGPYDGWARASALFGPPQRARPSPPTSTSTGIGNRSSCDLPSIRKKEGKIKWKDGAFCGEQSAYQRRPGGGAAALPPPSPSSAVLLPKGGRGAIGQPSKATVVTRDGKDAPRAAPTEVLGSASALSSVDLPPEPLPVAGVPPAGGAGLASHRTALKSTTAE